VALILFNLPARVTSRLKLSVSGIFLPLFGIAGSVSKAEDAVGMRVLPKSTLIAELQQLRRTNAVLTLKVTQQEEAVRENAALRKALQWQQRSPWKVRLARVIVREPSNWWRTLEIDLGSNAGVAANMPVVTENGLIGRIDVAQANYSRVVLIGDPKCRVAALVENEERSTGYILPGESTILDESIVDMTYISRLSHLTPGQRVVTSGLGGIFPKGIPIGNIVDVNSVGYGLYQDARIKLIADLRELEEVWVLFP
jgi:rod shape-determining protein MreC